MMAETRRLDNKDIEQPRERSGQFASKPVRYGGADPDVSESAANPVGIAPRKYHTCSIVADKSQRGYVLFFNGKPPQDLLNDMKKVAQCKWNPDNRTWLVSGNAESLEEWKTKYEYLVEWSGSFEELELPLLKAAVIKYDKNCWIVEFGGFPPDHVREGMKKSGRAIWDGDVKCWYVYGDAEVLEVWRRSTVEELSWVGQFADIKDGAVSKNPVKGILEGVSENSYRPFVTPSKDVKEGFWLLGGKHEEGSYEFDSKEYALRAAMSMGDTLGEDIDIHESRSLSASEVWNLLLPFDEPFPFQIEGMEWLLEHRRGILGDQPGLGKTFQAAAAVGVDGRLPVVVVCPPLVLNMWADTMQRTFPDGSVRVCRSGESIPESRVDEDVVVVSDSMLVKWLPHLPLRPASVIVDEAHRMKQPKSKRSKSAAALCLSAEKNGIVALLTGTPMPNRPGELATLLAATRRTEKFGGMWKFLDRYAPKHKIRARRGRMIEVRGTATKLLPELHEKLTGDVMIRRKKVDVLSELPPKFRQMVTVNLDNEMWRIYDKQEDEILTDLIESISYKAEEATLQTDYQNNLLQHYENATTVAFENNLDSSMSHEQRKKTWRKAVSDMVKEEVRIAKNKEAKSDNMVADSSNSNIFQLRRLLAYAKAPLAMEWIENWLESSETGDSDAPAKLLVFGHHIGLLDSVAAYFDAPKIAGGVPDAERQRIIEEWQNDPDGPRVMLFSTSVGTEGITLTAASDALFLEQPWNPGVCQQAEDRLHRIGQTKQVTCAYLVAADTIDEAVADLVARKATHVNVAMDGGEHRPASESEDGDSAMISAIDVLSWRRDKKK